MVSCIIAVLLQEMFVYGLTYWPVRIEPLLHLYGNLQSRDFSDIYGKSIIGHQTKAPHTFLNQKESFVLQRLWPSFHLVFGVR